MIFNVWMIFRYYGIRNNAWSVECNKFIIFFFFNKKKTIKHNDNHQISNILFLNSIDIKI